MARIILGGIEIDPGPRRDVRFGGTQALVRHDIPGAGPFYQDMGAEEAPVSWDGYLDGVGAVDTALSLERLRESGQTVELSTGILPPVRVRVRSFEYRVVRPGRVEYSIYLVRDVAVPDFTPAPEPEEGAAPVSQTHTVVAGDTLWALSLRYLGSGDQWPAIAVANSITDPGALRVGQVLTVPAPNEVPALVAQYTGRYERQNARLTALAATGGSGIDRW